MPLFPRPGPRFVRGGPGRARARPLAPATCEARGEEEPGQGVAEPRAGSRRPKAPGSSLRPCLPAEGPPARPPARSPRAGVIWWPCGAGQGESTPESTLDFPGDTRARPGAGAGAGEPAALLGLIRLLVAAGARWWREEADTSEGSRSLE